MKKYFVSLLLFFIFNSLAQTTLISAGSSWKYFDGGVLPAANWNQASFNDASWSNGSTEIGYGDGDENTIASYGPSSSNKFVTTYFRKTISIVNPSIYTFLDLGVVCDDGCVVYVNGVEVYRQNMPSGTINNNTLASSTVAWPFEDDWTNSGFSPLTLVAGNNVIAVEAHQDDVTSSDISFNFELNAYTTPQPITVLRGPYLQKANQNQITICWRTDNACDSKIEFGLSPSALTQEVVDPAFVTNHFITINGLSENTKYYYKIGSSSGMISSSYEQSFQTHPQEGSTDTYRFWVIGDAGSAEVEQDLVTQSFLNYNQGKRLDGWIMLGDNAYESGFDNEYQGGVFDAYPQILPNTVLWPSPGNHDYNNHIPLSPAPAYYEIFNLPTNAEAGGQPSGTEKYYSWNFGNVHFISLDSYDEGRGPTDPMALWLETDLASNSLPWVVVYWHHPPYTKGSHDSDNWLLDGELIDMRENILPILENYGVDLVLNGHSHSYERTPLLDGHYGNSGSLNPAIHFKDPGSGDYVNECPYLKYTNNGVGHLGTVYAVVGCSGKTSSVDSDWPHPAMYSYAEGTLGSMLIEVKNNRMDCKFITSDGIIYDQFSIVKNAGGFSQIEVCQGDQITLTPSWGGNAYWQPSNLWAASYTFNALIPSVYFAEDTLGCFADTIEVVLADPVNCGLTIEEQKLNEISLLNPLIKQGEILQILIGEGVNFNQLKVDLFAMNGSCVFSSNYEVTQQILLIPTQAITANGTYVLNVSGPIPSASHSFLFVVK